MERTTPPTSAAAQSALAAGWARSAREASLADGTQAGEPLAVVVVDLLADAGDEPVELFRELGEAGGGGLYLQQALLALFIHL